MSYIPPKASHASGSGPRHAMAAWPKHIEAAKAAPIRVAVKILCNVSLATHSAPSRAQLSTPTNECDGRGPVMPRNLAQRLNKIISAHIDRMRPFAQTGPAPFIRAANIDQGNLTGGGQFMRFGHAQRVTRIGRTGLQGARTHNGTAPSQNRPKDPSARDDACSKGR